MHRTTRVLLMLLLATCHIAHSLIDGLLPNGNFEKGPSRIHMKGTRLVGRHAIPHWEISGEVEYIKSGQKQGDMLLPVPEGESAVRLGENARIKTTINATKGLFYAVTFIASRTCAQDEKLNISVSPNSEPDDSALLPTQTTYSSDGWDSYSWGFWAESDQIQIEIHNPIGREEDEACGPIIDSVALKALTLPKYNRANILKNGDFEEGPYLFPKTSWGVLIPPKVEDDHSPLPGWIIESLKAVKYIDAAHFAVPQGQRAIELVAGKESSIVQIVKTIPGKLYALTFVVGDGNNSCQGSMQVEAFAGIVSTQVPYESKGTGGYKKANLQFKAVSTRTRIRFLSTYYLMKNDHTGTLCGPVIDDIKLLGVRHPRRI